MTIVTRTHRFLGQRLFYQLALASLIACGILAVRMWISGSVSYIFMLWNLFLAWVPYWWAIWADTIQLRYPGRWWRLLLPAFVWLAFLPNAPYLVTDLAHLHWRDGSLLWYDTGMLAVFAWTGCFLAVTSLRIMRDIVAANLGWLASRIFVTITIGISGAGVYIGRVLRWNSWDIVRRPFDLLSDILEHAARREAHGITLLFAAMLFICYLTFPGSQQEQGVVDHSGG